MNAIAAAIAGAFDAVLSVMLAALKTVGTGIVAVLEAISSGLLAVIRDVAGAVAAGIKAIGSGGLAAAKTVAAAVLGAPAACVGVASDVLNFSADGIALGVQNVDAVFGVVASAFYDTASAVARAVAGATGPAARATRSFFASAVSLIVNVARGSFSALASGIALGMVAVVDALIDVLERVGGMLETGASGIVVSARAVGAVG